MKFMDKMNAKVRAFFIGRNGVDSLGRALILSVLILSVLNLFLGLRIVMILEEAACVWALFRMLSKNLPARQAENAKYLQWFGKWRTEGMQAFARAKNVRRYRYFRCPECHERLRMPRGVGEKTVTCTHCRHTFRQKA